MLLLSWAKSLGQRAIAPNRFHLHDITAVSPRQPQRGASRDAADRRRRWRCREAARSIRGRRHDRPPSGRSHKIMMNRQNLHVVADAAIEVAATGAPLVPQLVPQSVQELIADSARIRRKQVLDAIRRATDDLAGTPAICRKSYVHATIVTLERFTSTLKGPRSLAKREQLLAQVVVAAAA
jgi:DNA topoisomerase I